MRVGGRYPFSSFRQRGNSLTSWWTQHNYQRPKGLWNITSVDNRSASVGFQLNRSLAFEKQEIKKNRAVTGSEGEGRMIGSQRMQPRVGY